MLREDCIGIIGVRCCDVYVVESPRTSVLNTTKQFLHCYSVVGM